MTKVGRAELSFQVSDVRQEQNGTSVWVSGARSFWHSRPVRLAQGPFAFTFHICNDRGRDTVGRVCK